MAAADVSQVASTHSKQRSEKYTEGTFHGSHVLWGFFGLVLCFVFSTAVGSH